MREAVMCVVMIMIAITIRITPSHAVNPGFRVILTTKGLDYAHETGLAVLKEWLCNEKIPTINITSSVGNATVEYNFTNIGIRSLNFGKSSLTSDSRGIVLSDDGLSISASTDWRIYEDAWPYYTDYGTGNVSMTGISLSVSSDILTNSTNGGHFAVHVTSCKFSLDDISVIFHGGASFLYNLFGLAINEILKYRMNTKGCKKIEAWINTKGNEYVASLPVVLNVSDGVAIDYALVADATFTHKGYVVTDHKVRMGSPVYVPGQGEFLLRSNPAVHLPFVPKPLPDPSGWNESKMVYVIATTFVAESASYAFWEAGQLVYNVTSDQLKIFGTTDAWCLSTLVPQELCEKYPDMKVMFGVVASDYPRLNVNTEYAAMNATANVSMYVDNEGKEEIAFTLALAVQADVDPYFNNSGNRICASVSNIKLANLSLVYSNIGPFDVSNLSGIINAALPALCPFINKYTKAGFPIPKLNGISFGNSSIELGEGFVVVGSDIHYSTHTEHNTTCTYKPH